MNVYGYDAKARSKLAQVVDATVAYTVCQKVQVVILSIDQAIQRKDLNHHLLYPMLCCVNGVLINEFPKFLALIPN